MNRKVLITSVALAATSICSTALAKSQNGNIYGKMNISYQLNDNQQDGDGYILSSNASRFGFKGSRDLSNSSLSVIYKLEFETYIDDGEKDKGQTIKQRNSFGGLKGSFGSFKAGIFDTPLKAAQGKFDLFNDLSGDIKQVIEGENRVKNIVQYSSPSIANGIVINAAIVPGENSLDSNLDGPADGISASITYHREAFYIAVATDSDIDQQDALRLVTSYKLGNLALAGIIQNVEKTDGSNYANGKRDVDSVGFSFAYEVSNNILKLQYVNSDSTTSVAEGEQLSIGIDHKLDKSTKIFAFYTDQNAKTTLNQVSYLGLGLEHKF